MSRVVLYARVSTADQTSAHQLTQARAAGFKINDEDVVSDNGVSGVSTRLADRPEGRRLYDMLREGDTLVVRWVDRLGRNYSDVTETIREFMRRKVIVCTVINGMIFDGATLDPVKMAVRDSLIAFMAATAQAQAEASKEAQKAGIAHAQEKDARSYRGRKPDFTRAQFETVRDMLRQGAAAATVTKATGLSRQSVYRLRDDPERAERILAIWEKAA